MPKLREKMETRRFVRSLIEARRRYRGPTDHSTTVIERGWAPPAPASELDAPQQPDDDTKLPPSDPEP